MKNGHLISAQKNVSEDPFFNHHLLIYERDAACDEVRVISSHFQTDDNRDYVVIDGKSYSDVKSRVDPTVTKNSFTV